MQENTTWENYYRKLEGRPPRPLFLEALARFASGLERRESLHAIDLGCGDGTETRVLLDAGWQVLAVDSTAAAIAAVRSKADPEQQSRLEVRTATFEELEFPATDFVYAGYSLPFCRPEHFEHLWQNITACIRPGGRFTGQFFGIHDSWADAPAMTFHSAGQVARLLAQGFEVETLREWEKDGEAVSGPKHWHVFDVIARRIDA